MSPFALFIPLMGLCTGVFPNSPNVARALGPGPCADVMWCARECIFLCPLLYRALRAGVSLESCAPFCSSVTLSPDFRSVSSAPLPSAEASSSGLPKKKTPPASGSFAPEHSLVSSTPFYSLVSSGSEFRCFLNLFTSLISRAAFRRFRIYSTALYSCFFFFRA